MPSEKGWHFLLTKYLFCSNVRKMKPEQIIKFLKLGIYTTLFLIAIEIVFIIPAVKDFFVGWVQNSSGWVLWLVLWILFLLQCNILNIPAVSLLQISVLVGIKVLSWQYILLVMSAYMSGCILSYWLGRWFGSRAIKWVAGSEEDFEKWSGFINRKGKWWYFLTVLLPLFSDDLLCICAGAIKMDFKFYVFANLIGRTIGLVTMLLVLNYIGLASSNVPIMLIVWCVGLIAEIVAYLILKKGLTKQIR